LREHWSERHRASPRVSREAADRETKLYGARELRSFRTAATKYLQEYGHKKRIKDDALQLKQLDPFNGSLELQSPAKVPRLPGFGANQTSDGGANRLI
jgi:hypothetical protein